MLPRLYRSQLRLARYYDQNPVLKCLIGPHPAVPLTAARPGDALAGAVHDCLEAHRAAFAAQHRGGVPSASLYDYVRGEYRAAQGNLAASFEARVGGGSDFELNVGVNAQRALEAVAASGTRELEANVDNVAAALPAGALGPLEEAPALTPGCLLVEAPTSSFQPGGGIYYVWDISQNIQNMHGNEDWMVRCFIINRPFPASVATITRRNDLGAFGGLTLFFGGGDNEHLAVLHRIKDLEGAAAVDEAETLFIGGSVEDIDKRLRSGVNSGSDFKVVMGAVEMKLEKDPVSGELSLPDADKYIFVGGPGAVDATLLPPMFDTTGKWRDGGGLSSSPGGAEAPGYAYGRFWHQDAVWAAVVAGLGRSKAGSAYGDALVAASRYHPGVLHGVAGDLPVPIRLARFDAVEEAQAGEVEQEGEVVEGNESKPLA